MLTNAHRQSLRVVPWNSHSALVLSTLALLVTLEVQKCYPTTAGSLLIHLVHTVPRHQLALWVVPLYWSGHWSCGLHTVHSLISRPDGQRHVRLCVIEVSPAIPEGSSVHCESEKEWQEEENQKHWIIVCNMWCFRLSYVWVCTRYFGATWSTKNTAI